mmetsp:Transcript_25042/g.28866  ORF Transcript_25042/g.28866 Transcript_25042/m.28866 type:complete len:141 (+) Transcript_25042:208-630(+)
MLSQELSSFAVNLGSVSTTPQKLKWQRKIPELTSLRSRIRFPFATSLTSALFLSNSMLMNKTNILMTQTSQKNAFTTSDAIKAQEIKHNNDSRMPIFSVTARAFTNYKELSMDYLVQFCLKACGTLLRVATHPTTIPHHN